MAEMGGVGEARIERSKGHIVLFMLQLEAQHQPLPHAKAAIGTPNCSLKRCNKREGESPSELRARLAVVAVRFVADQLGLSLFQRTEGKCQYADNSFVTDDGVMPVL